MSLVYTDNITCVEVSALPEIMPDPGPLTWTCQHGRCADNQTRTDPYPYCGEVDSMKIGDGGSTDLKHLVCAAFGDTSEEQKEWYQSDTARGLYGLKPDGTNELSNYQNPDLSSTPYKPYSDYPDRAELSATLIANPNINDLRTFLSTEITRRATNNTYRSELSNIEYPNKVLSGNNIIDTQQQQLLKTLRRLKYVIQNKNDYADEKSYLVNEGAAVIQEDMVETVNLKGIEQDLWNSVIDCICYSDCTGFKLYQKQFCTCNINCLCNYW